MAVNNSTQLDTHAPAVAMPARVGQGTAVEQSRAVAEVQAAVVVAQQVPRSVTTARTAMRESCDVLPMAERAFFRYKRGGAPVAGASVHLARELARCWGNVQYGIAELRRDDLAGESEMQAWAWDVQTNTRASNTFVVPHKRDKTGGPVALTDMRDIYENNANMGARRLREAIFSILPPWFTEEAKELCAARVEKGDGRPVVDRADDAVAAFEKLGVAQDRLEQKLGRVRARWSQYDLAQLMTVHRSISRGEVTVDDEFPRPRLSDGDALAETAAPAEAQAPARRRAPVEGRE